MAFGRRERPPDSYYIDHLDLLIRDADLAVFRHTMESAGYRRILHGRENETRSERAVPAGGLLGRATE